MEKMKTPMEILNPAVEIIQKEHGLNIAVRTLIAILVQYSNTEEKRILIKKWFDELCELMDQLEKREANGQENFA